MTKTDNLNLPQWVEEDPFQREDFNEAFASLDEGYAANAASCEATAQVAAEAVSIAEAASVPSYVVGSYTGNGAAQTIAVGFQPSFVLVDGVTGTTTQSMLSSVNYYRGVTGGNVSSDFLTLVETGFTVTPVTNYYPNLSEYGRTYDYIAFR